MSADPLAPPFQDEAAVRALLARGQRRIAHEELMDAVAAIDEGVGQIDHARRQPAYERVAVRSFERDEHNVVHGSTDNGTRR